MPTLASKLIAGSALRSVSFLVGVVVAFYLMPFLVRSLGDRWYGLWVIVGAFVGYYGYLDFGLSSAVARFIAKHHGSGEIRKVNEVVSTAMVLFTGLGLIAFLVASLVALLAGRFFGDPQDLAIFRGAVLITGASFAVGMPFRALGGVLESHLRYDLTVYCRFLVLGVRTALIVLFMARGHGVIALALISASADILGHAMLVIFIRTACPGVSVLPRGITAAQVRILTGYGGYTFVAQLGDLMRFRLDNVVIAAFLGAAPVTLYAIAAHLMHYFIQFMSSLIGIMMPVFSQYEGRGDFDEIRKKLLLTTKISSFWAVLVGGLAGLCSKPFVARWMGPDYQNAADLVYVLAPALVLALAQMPSVNALYGISRHKFFAIANAGEGAANLLLSLLLVRSHGLLGVALGTAIPMVVIKTAVQPVYLCRCVGLRLSDYYRVLWRSIGAGLLPLAISWAAFKPMLSPHYASLFSFCALSAFVYFLLGVHLIFEKKERVYLLDCLLRRQSVSKHPTQSAIPSADNL